jgi:hypothetical protein
MIDYTDEEIDQAIRDAVHTTYFVNDFLAERDRRRAKAESDAANVRAVRLEKATWLAAIAAIAWAIAAVGRCSSHNWNGRTPSLGRSCIHHPQAVDTDPLTPSDGVLQARVRCSPALRRVGADHRSRTPPGSSRAPRPRDL